MRPQSYIKPWRQVTPHNLHKLLRRVVRLCAIICVRVRTTSAKPYHGNSGITLSTVLLNYYPVTESSRSIYSWHGH